MILSVCWICESSTGLPSARLNHKHLSCLALELLEPGVSPSREHQRSCQCTVSVLASMSSARLNHTRLPFTTGMSTTSFSYCTALEHLNHFLDLLDVGHWLSAEGVVVHRRGMNFACGISSVFAMFGTCPCIRVYDLKCLRDLLDASSCGICMVC